MSEENNNEQLVEALAQEQEQEAPIEVVEETQPIVEVNPLKDIDISLAVSHILKVKAYVSADNESINIYNDNIVHWNLKIPQPTVEELIAAYEEATADALQDQINSQALKYLADTDWYIIRTMDSGVAIPEEVVQLRQQARDRIVK